MARYWEAAERGAFKGRLSEICLGIVANVRTPWGEGHEKRHEGWARGMGNTW